MSQPNYLEKVGKLLRQAERAGTPEEAEAFFAKAQELATVNAIDLAVARAHVGKHEKREEPIIENITIGPRGKRGLASLVKLFLAIAEVNDVQCNIAHNSTYVIAFGFKSDIELCETLYASLVIQMVRASDAYLKTGAYKHEQAYRTVTRKNASGESYRDYDLAPVPGQTARREFHTAFTYKIKARLRQAREETTEQVVADEREREHVVETESTGAELAIIEKKVEIADFYKARSTAKGSWRGGRTRSSGSSQGAREAGRQAGDHARLGTEKAIGGGHKAVES